jgi:hypothetical protein
LTRHPGFRLTFAVEFTIGGGTGLSAQIRLAAERGSRVSHDFISKLAKDIKEKDHEDLIKKEHQLHVAKIIHEKGQALWNQLAAKLKEYVEALRADLGNPVLDAELRFDNDPTGQIKINKQEFPFVNFTMTLNLDGQMISGTWMKANPWPTGAPMGTRFIKIEFKANQEDHVYMVMDGVDHHDAESLAKAIMEMLFTV